MAVSYWINPFSSLLILVLLLTVSMCFLLSPSLNASKAFQRKNLTLSAYVFIYVIIFLKYSGGGFTVMKLSLTEPSGHPGWSG